MQAYDTPHPPHSNANALALGLDAGGTQARWAVAGADGGIQAEGQVAGFSALQLANAAGRAAAQALLAEVARNCGVVQAVVAGVTGFDLAQVRKSASAR